MEACSVTRARLRCDLANPGLGKDRQRFAMAEHGFGIQLPALAQTRIGSPGHVVVQMVTTISIY